MWNWMCIVTVFTPGIIRYRWNWVFEAVTERNGSLWIHLHFFRLKLVLVLVLTLVFPYSPSPWQMNQAKVESNVFYRHAKSKNTRNIFKFGKKGTPNWHKSSNWNDLRKWLSTAERTSQTSSISRLLLQI